MFEEEGTGGKWSPHRKEGNPGKLAKVYQYLEFIKKKQGLARITPKQAKVILRGKVKQLIELLKI